MYVLYKIIYLYIIGYFDLLIINSRFRIGSVETLDFTYNKNVLEICKNQIFLVTLQFRSIALSKANKPFNIVQKLKTIFTRYIDNILPKGK